MQLEATDWSIRPTLVVHPQGFTPVPGYEPTLSFAKNHEWRRHGSSDFIPTYKHF